jgi:toxin ParE1/3/4
LTIIWLPRALADRDAQIDFIAKDSPRAAIEQGDRIEEQIEVLNAHPEIGRRGRVSGTRELVVSRTPFIAVYRIRMERIEILRVLHGAQMWPPKSNA